MSTCLSHSNFHVYWPGLLCMADKPKQSLCNEQFYLFRYSVGIICFWQTAVLPWNHPHMVRKAAAALNPSYYKWEWAAPNKALNYKTKKNKRSLGHLPIIRFLPTVATIYPTSVFQNDLFGYIFLRYTLPGK